VFSTLRNASRTTTLVIAIGLLGTVGADIVTAVTGSGTAVAAGSHHAGHGQSDDVTAYVNALRPLAVQLRVAVAPDEKIIEAIAVPRAGDAFAARDAVTHGTTLSAVRTVSKRLAALKAPAPMASHHRDMSRAVGSIEAAMAKLQTLRNLQNPAHLVARIDEIGSNQLETAEGNWDAALQAAFRLAHAKAPLDFSRGHLVAPVSRTSWIFNADRTCTAASYRLAGLAELAKNPSLSNGEKLARRWSRTMNWTGGRLAAIKRPRGVSRVPATLRSHLRVLGAVGKIFGQELGFIRNQNFAGAARSVEQLREISGSVELLASAMNRYGAHSCGLVIGSWGSSSPHHHSSVST